MTGAEFRAAAGILWPGHGWRPKAAKALGISIPTVDRYANDRKPVRPSVAIALEHLLADHNRKADAARRQRQSYDRKKGGAADA